MERTNTSRHRLWKVLILLPLLTSLTHAEPYPGYTLFAQNNSRNTNLINLNNATVHSWASNRNGGYSYYLLENGHLLRTAQVNNPQLNGGGAQGIVQDYNWNGTLVWEYTYSSATYLSHHDIEPMPNGNVLLIAWEVKTAAQARQAGLNRNHSLWPDHIIEVRPSGANGGTIVWQWHAWDHLIQDYDPARDNYGVVGDHPELFDINIRGGGGGPQGGDWMHINGISYNPDLDQIVISSHTLDEIYVIDHSTTTAEAAGHTGGNAGRGGDILYRWGNPSNYDAPGAEVFQVVHCSVWIPEGCPGWGNIMAFNNREGLGTSMIVELVPPYEGRYNYTWVPGQAYGPAAPVWTYTAAGFYSNHLGGCQRLPNGNTIISESTSGYLFEVNAAGVTQWSYNYGREVVRVLRYPTDYPGVYALNPVANGVFVINEFLLDNEVTVTDPAGESDPWIELYNNGNTSRSLWGFYLSDDSNDLDKWAFPNTTIAAHGYLIVWLDGDIEQEGWHANFTPNVAGGRLLFSAPNLTILDQVIYPAQMTDVSYGRFPNGTGAFMQLVPTFGTENQENPPPVIHSMSQLPNTINAEKICTVEAEISDNNGWTTDTANLNVSINNGPPDVFEMTDPNHDGVFTAQFDLADYRVTPGDQVSYWIEVQDDAGALGSNIDDQLSFNIIELMNPEAEILVVSDNMEDRFNVIVTYLDDSDIEYELYDIDQNKGIDEYTVDGGAWGTIFVCGRSTLLPTREYQTCPFRNVVAEDKNFILSDMDYFAGNGENAAPVFSAGDLAYDLFGIESGVNDPVPTDSVFFGEPGDVISGNWTDQPFITYPNRYSSDQADFVVPNANGVPIFTGEEMENFQALRCDFNNRKSAYFAFDIFSNCRKDSLYNPERNEWDYWLEPTEDFNTLMNNLTAWFDVGQISYMSINLRMNYFELTSLYITPPDLAAAEVFGGINDLVIVYQDDGHIYIPPFINTIGNITITEGYQIFCSQPSSLTIVGSPVNPAIQYNLQSNRWNWLGYPFDYPIPINVALSGIADRITIAMNDGGGFWIPPFINTLGNMIPGEGYFIFVTQNLTFQYNPGIMKIAGSSNEVWDIPEAENAPPATGLPYVVLVRLTEHLKKLQPDVIELYDDHLLVGKAGVLKDYELTPVIAWGGAPDYNLAGFAVGHPMTIKVKSADKEISTVCGGQPVLFGEGAYAEVELEVDSPAIPTEFTVKSAYPNPFNPTVTIPFAVPSKGELSFTIYNVLGQQVFQQNRIFEAGYFEFLFDASLTENNLVSGIYFIQIQYNDQSNIQKVILMR